MKGGCILLVEDATEQAQLMRKWLERDGFRVTVVHDGAAGVALCRRAEFDLVMTDIELPFSKGHSILEWSKAEYPQRPVILLSAFEMSEATPPEKADGFLQKPLHREEIQAMVFELFEASAEWRIERTMRESFEMAVFPYAARGA